ncbi:hypothetical protein [Vibrio cholerae]|uniref:hypothetical protein n=1 Tax=Vibrio cholerae TaxID=666 RepID=UPI001C30EDCB|nr:hypothetical protein [Vibrio cholerae]EII3729066.1 hypothetical protein [Vibrio cholerae]ELJ8596249.1 hypothetical protein [Vibrio cholerae]MDA5316004.1 hypothetical protein [Vibrio cholerae]MDN6972597.1 hypothetical protein [Vibrio cholerae]GHY17900.1 hypothetical protein VCSRO163_3638 [Vibrio cholerae]
MEKHTFLDRYFRSYHDLLDLESIDNHNVNALFTYLNNLHSTADKLKDLFNCNIKDFPDFKLLRIVRNYFHHVDDVEDVRLLVSFEENVQFERVQHLIIPAETVARSIKSFVDKNMVPEEHRQHKKKLDFVTNELAAVSSCYSYLGDILNNMEMCCNKPSLKLDGVVYELGFDMYRFIFNVTNLIVEKCKDIEELSSKDVIKQLGEEFSVANNIGRIDMYCSADKMPITTTQGMIYARSIELAI